MGMGCCYEGERFEQGDVPKGYVKHLMHGEKGQGTKKTKHVGGTKPPKSIGGFNVMQFSDEDVTIATRTHDGTEVYSTQVPRRQDRAHPLLRRKSSSSKTIGILESGQNLRMEA